MKTKTWILCFLALFVLLLCAAWLLMRQKTGHIANIYQDGQCICSIDLSDVTESYSFSITDSHGHENLVEVEPGRIRIAEANCPDQVCVDTGWISNGLRPIVCLPAKLSIQMENTPQVDGSPIDAVVG